MSFNSNQNQRDQNTDTALCVGLQHGRGGRAFFAIGTDLFATAAFFVSADFFGFAKAPVFALTVFVLTMELWEYFLPAASCGLPPAAAAGDQR
jgi:hypothetical protein